MRLVELGGGCGLETGECTLPVPSGTVLVVDAEAVYNILKKHGRAGRHCDIVVLLARGECLAVLAIEAKHAHGWIKSYILRYTLYKLGFEKKPSIPELTERLRDQLVGCVKLVYGNLAGRIIQPHIYLLAVAVPDPRGITECVERHPRLSGLPGSLVNKHVSEAARSAMGVFRSAASAACKELGIACKPGIIPCGAEPWRLEELLSSALRSCRG